MSYLKIENHEHYQWVNDGAYSFGIGNKHPDRDDDESRWLFYDLLATVTEKINQIYVDDRKPHRRLLTVDWRNPDTGRVYRCEIEIAWDAQKNLEQFGLKRIKFIKKG